MLIKVTIGDAVFEVETVAQAREIAGLPPISAANGRIVADKIVGAPIPLPPPARKRGRPPGSTKRTVAQKHPKLVPTLAFLKAMASAGRRGISSEQANTVMDTGGTRGLGGVMISVRNIIKGAGFDPDSVFEMGGKPGDRRWIGGQRIAEAITKLEGGEKWFTGHATEQ